MEKTNEENPNELVVKILSHRDQFLKECPNIRCLIFTVLEENSDQPIVVFHGDQVEYTALSVAIAKVLRQRIIDRVDGNEVQFRKSQQTLDTNNGTEQRSGENGAGARENIT